MENDNEVQAVLTQGTEKEIGNAEGPSDPYLFALIPRNQNQPLKGLNCVNLTVKGRCQPKASETPFLCPIDGLHSGSNIQMWPLSVNLFLL